MEIHFCAFFPTNEACLTFSPFNRQVEHVSEEEKEKTTKQPARFVGNDISSESKLFFVFYIFSSSLYLDLCCSPDLETGLNYLPMLFDNKYPLYRCLASAAHLFFSLLLFLRRVCDRVISTGVILQSCIGYGT